ncbi:unnamed protein product [Thelazia callipaeda]|uniref:Transcription initiation factor IIF subunit alpha n=1 Tax=Thelazia callipaeda TaxID=103827 RepID=A0A0N5CMS1_THECL|nr:unnamed protein product [Thelazia callipaeda]
MSMLRGNCSVLRWLLPTLHCRNRTTRFQKHDIVCFSASKLRDYLKLLSAKNIHWSSLKSCDPINSVKEAGNEGNLNVDWNELEEALQKTSYAGDEKKDIRRLKREKRRIRGFFTGKLIVIIVSVSVILVVILSGMREEKMRELENERKRTLGKARIGGPWELIDMDGNLGGSEQLKGNWLLLYFGFTNCPDVCPDSIEKMVEVVETVKKSDEKINLVPVFISVDPDRDTVERVKEYCAEFSPKIKGYTGSKDQVAKVAKAFRVYYSQGPRTDQNDYIVDHTVIMYLVDPDGEFHDYYGQNRSSEEIAKVIKRSALKRYSILKFNDTLKVDPGKWATAGYSLQMVREDNKSQATASEIRQDFGEGSEFGKALREEAKRKKYGRQTRTYQLDNQPWVLSIGDSSGKERKFRSIREGGAGEHADYWVFLKSGEELHAFKVDEWHQFLPFLTHRTLDIDQAEERFRERNRVMNQFALKAQIQQQLKAMDDDGEQMIRTTRSLKIRDEASSGENSDGEKGDDEDDAPDVSLKLKKNTKLGNRARKDRRQRVENADEVAAYESDDGDDEGREYDYMSDSGSESDRDVIPIEQRVDEAMVAVGDETGLKKLISDDFNSDSSESEYITKKLLTVTDENDDSDSKKQFNDVDDRDSSGSDSDDPDKEINSAIFLPVKKNAEDMQLSSRKRPLEEGASIDVEPKKVKTENLNAVPSSSSSSVTQAVGNQDGLNEETVRRYLRRKPHTTKELLSRIKSKCGDMEKSEIVQQLAAILKHIEPHQFKQKHGKKEVLFFSINNTVA